MRCHDSAAHRETESHPARLGGYKRLEDAFDIARSNASAFVGYDNLDAGAVTVARTDGDAPPIRQAFHGVAGIDEEIQHNLLQLDAVAEQRRHAARREISDNRDVSVDEVASHQGKYVLNDGV